MVLGIRDILGYSLNSKNSTAGEQSFRENLRIRIWDFSGSLNKPLLKGSGAKGERIEAFLIRFKMRPKYNEIA
jgi:hypothetical protein